MTGSNHAVAGALIGAIVVQPLVAVPVALASHFVMDAMPHYGDTNKHSWLNRNFHYVLITDGLVGVTFLASIVLVHPAHWSLILLCALVAVSPDLVWLPHYIADLRGKSRPHGAFARFSKWIQWGERPWGIYIELAAFVGLITVFLQTIR